MVFTKLGISDLSEQNLASKLAALLPPPPFNNSFSFPFSEIISVIKDMVWGKSFQFSSNPSKSSPVS